MGKLSTSTLMTMTVDPAPPAAPTPLPSSHALWLSLLTPVLCWCSHSLRLYPAALYIRCHPLTPTLSPGARLVPGVHIAPGARLALTVAFAATLPGRLSLLDPVLRRWLCLLQHYPSASDQFRPITSRTKWSRFKIISASISFTPP